MRKLLFVPAAVAMLAVAGCGTQQTSQPKSSTAPTNTSSASTSEAAYKIAKAESTQNIGVNNNTFGPVVAVVHVGDTVTWTNQDSREHKIVSYPTDPQQFAVDIRGNQKGTYTFTKPGVYRYYGGNFATYSKKMSDVEAKKKASNYPVPMRGVIVVLNKNNTLPASKSASVDVPDSTMAFTPWDLVVKKGTTVHFSNHDDMTHMVASVPGYVTKKKPTLTLKKDGGTGQLAFDEPGVYYYYCPMHAQWDSTTQQLVPQKSYGSFPFVMDGLIIVTSK